MLDEKHMDVSPDDAGLRREARGEPMPDIDDEDEW